MRRLRRRFTAFLPQACGREGRGDSHAACKSIDRPVGYRLYSFAKLTSFDSLDPLFERSCSSSFLPDREERKEKNFEFRKGGGGGASRKRNRTERFTCDPSIRLLPLLPTLPLLGRWPGGGNRGGGPGMLIKAVRSTISRFD